MVSPSNTSEPELPFLHDDNPETPLPAQCMTILMPVAVTTSDHRHLIPGSPPRAINGFILPIESRIQVGDRTDNGAEDLTIAIVGVQPPNVAEDNRSGDEALPVKVPVDDPAAAEESRTVDLGWGIVVGEISREDFYENLSFPKLFDI